MTDEEFKIYAQKSVGNSSEGMTAYALIRLTEAVDRQTKMLETLLRILIKSV